MKKNRIRYFGALCAIASLIFIGCDTDNTDDPIIDDTDYSNYIDWSVYERNGLDTEGGAGTLKLKVTSSSNWSMSLDKETNDGWCSVTPMSGEQYSDLTIEIGVNPIDEDRNTTLIVTLDDGAEYTIVLNQSAATTLIELSSTSPIEFDIDGGKQQLMVKSNSDLIYKFIKSDNIHATDQEASKWITCSEIDGGVEIETIQNNSSRTLSTQLLICSTTDDSYYKIVDISQGGTAYKTWGDYMLSGIVNETTEAQNITISVGDVTDEWSIEWADQAPAWCSFDITGSIAPEEIQEVTFVFDGLTTPGDQSATLNVMVDGTVKYEIDVVQRGLEATITINIESAEIAKAGGSTEWITVKSNSSWTCSFIESATAIDSPISVDWVTANSPGNIFTASQVGNTNGSQVKFDIKENSSNKRVAYILFRSEADTKKYEVFTITQANGNAVTELSTPTNLAFGGSSVPTVMWNAVTDAETYTLTATKSVGGETLFTKDNISSTTYAIQMADYGDYMGSIDLSLIAVAGNVKSSEAKLSGEHTHFGSVDGDGSEGKPYIINAGWQLANIKTNLDKHFKQTTEISVEKATFFPIEGEFTGLYDGGNFAINDLSITTESDNAALFTTIGSAGTIQNVNLVDCNITGKIYVGSIAGTNRGTISGCTVSGVVKSSNSTATTSIYLGGIVGDNNGGTITKTTNHAVVNDNSLNGNLVGGIAGVSRYNSTISHTSNYGSVSGNAHIAGFVGYLGDSAATELSTTETIADCRNRGAVKSGSGGNKNGGGFIASIAKTNANISNCANEASVVASGPTGGIVGATIDLAGMKIAIDNCYNSGNIECNASAIGSHNASAGIMASNNLSSSSSSIKITNCYNSGAITAGSKVTGGIVAYTFKGQKSLCFTLSGCVTINSAPQTGDHLTSNTGYTNSSDDEMKTPAPYANWDSSIWNITAGSYPTLKSLPNIAN